MPEGASIAEASVQLTLDESGLSAEVINLQGKLGPAISQATTGMTSVSAAATQTTGNVIALSRGFGQLGTMVSSGTVTTRGLLSLVTNVAAGIGGVVSTAVTGIGAIIAAGYGAFKLGDFLGNKFSGAGEVQAWGEKTGKEMADQVARNFERYLASSITAIKMPDVNTAIGLDRQQEGFSRSAMDIQMQIELATAERTGKSVASIKEKYALLNAEKVREFAMKERTQQEAGIEGANKAYAAMAENLAKRREITTDPAEIAKINDELANAEKLRQDEVFERQKRIATLENDMTIASGQAKLAHIEAVEAAQKKADEDKIKRGKEWQEKTIAALREEQDAIGTEKGLVREDIQTQMDAARAKADAEQNRLSSGAASIWENMITAKPVDETIKIQEKGNQLLEILDGRLIEVRDAIKVTESVFGP